MRQLITTKLLCIFALMGLLCNCKRAEYRQAQGMIWNTTYSIVYEADTDLSDSIVATLKNVEESVSAFNPNSTVSRINKNISLETDSMFRTVWETALKINRESGGAFDPTLAPLINLYGFGYDKEAEQTEPDNNTIDEILTYVGIEKTSMAGSSIIKQDPRTEFNFSAIAKGFGCDCVARMFARNGVNNYMVEIGGEIRMSGLNSIGEQWHISIDKPIFTNNQEIHDSQTTVMLTDCGMATSGNYRNFKEVNGKRVVHTIDRYTGYPALNDLLSVTIVIFEADYPCMKADAYATACMSMGSDKAKAMVEKGRIAAMFILTDGSIWESSEFLNRVKTSDNRNNDK